MTSWSSRFNRRFAVLAAGLEQYDPTSDYQVDVFAGPRKDGPEKNMAVDYVRHAAELCHRSEEELTATFNTEISRAVRWESDRNRAAKEIVATHKRHGKAVTEVLRQKMAEQASEILGGTLDASSLLALAINPDHMRKSGRTNSETGLLSPEIARVMFREELQRFAAQVGGSSHKTNPVRRRKLKKHETVIFAAMTAKDPAAVRLGRKGGKATAPRRTKQERSEAARKAVLARWATKRKKEEQ